MFKLNDYIMKLIKEMIGKEADYKVRELALGWFSKGVLAEADLAEIDTLIEEKNTAENTTESAEIDTEIEEQEETPLILE